MDWLIQIILRNAISTGNIQITIANGPDFVCGNGTGTPLAIHFTSTAVAREVLLDPELKFGEAYVDGELIIQRGSIVEVLAVLLDQPSQNKPRYWVRIKWAGRYLYRRIKQWNTPRLAQRNVAHHYDLDDQLYKLFLDTDQQYTCAYFESDDQSLDDAQLAKKRLLAAKLLLEPGHRILDIGCGWGGLALYLSELCEVYATGITLSRKQVVVARTRVAERGLTARVKIQYQDYRNVRDRFDRIVSVGMFEHVGVPFYDLFFHKCAALLDDHGVMVLSSIGRFDRPDVTNPWIAKYIFPGGYIPALSEVIPAIEKSGLLITDIEIWRLHYAETLKAWRERFLAHRESVEKLYDSKFVRM